MGKLIKKLVNRSLKSASRAIKKAAYSSPYEKQARAVVKGWKSKAGHDIRSGAVRMGNTALKKYGPAAVKAGSAAVGTAVGAYGGPLAGAAAAKGTKTAGDAAVKYGSKFLGGQQRRIDRKRATM